MIFFLICISIIVTFLSLIHCPNDKYRILNRISRVLHQLFLSALLFSRLYVQQELLFLCIAFIFIQFYCVFTVLELPIRMIIDINTISDYDIGKAFIGFILLLISITGFNLELYMFKTKETTPVVHVPYIY